MKTARFVLKIVGCSLALCAAVCCVIAYWDKITECFAHLTGGLQEDPCADDYDDLDDWGD